MLRVAVITPSLNQGQFIERTVRSVLEQQHPALEYIICDGGSSDETLAVLQHFDSRVRIVSEPDRGQADAVNKGIALTSGDVIGWLNSDDVYRPGTLAIAADFLSAHPDVDVVYGDADLIDTDDAPLGRYATEPWSPKRLIERPILCQPAAFFRRRVVERYGPLDNSLQYCMDYEYWLRLSAHGVRFAYLPAVLAASRVHPRTKTQRDRLAIHAELNAMLQRRLGYVPASWLVNHAYTLTELNRVGRRGPRLPFLAQWVAQSAVLSWQWNGSISRELLADSALRIAAATRERLAPNRGRR